MPLCHKCGKEIPRKTGVYKVMKTGQYSGGSDYYRQVNLCPKCSEAMDQEDSNKKRQRLIFLLLGVLALAGLYVYWTYFR